MCGGGGCVGGGGGEDWRADCYALPRMRFIRAVCARMPRFELQPWAHQSPVGLCIILPPVPSFPGMRAAWDLPTPPCRPCCAPSGHTSPHRSQLDWHGAAEARALYCIVGSYNQVHVLGMSILTNGQCSRIARWRSTGSGTCFFNNCHEELH